MSVSNKTFAGELFLANISHTKVGLTLILNVIDMSHFPVMPEGILCCKRKNNNHQRWIQVLSICNSDLGIKTEIRLWLGLMAPWRPLRKKDKAKQEQTTGIKALNR